MESVEMLVLTDVHSQPVASEQVIVLRLNLHQTRTYPCEIHIFNINQLVLHRTFVQF
jgi:hypothetical protein